MPLNRSSFRFKTEIRIRNYEIDWQGVVHNAVYLMYLETGRVSYLQHLGVPINHDAIRNESRIVVARNEIDYVSPAHFDETLDVYTRISSIRNSSFTFEGLLIEQGSGRIVAENVSIHVWLSQTTRRPAPVGDWFRKAVRAFEGENVQILWLGGGADM